MGDMADWIIENNIEDQYGDWDDQREDDYAPPRRRVSDLAAEGLWRTRDGSTFTISDMSDDHLRNAARMLASYSPPSPFTAPLSAEMARRGME